MTTTRRQTTLAAPARVRGTGIHTGRRVTLTLRPADEGHGIRFCRTDLPGKPVVPATIDHVVWSKLSNRTTLGSEEVEIQTPEHVLSALLGVGVDNARIDLTGEECPGLDNSAKPYVDAIAEVGLVEQSARSQVVTLTEPITVWDESSGAEATAVPSNRLELTFFAEFPEGYFLGPQTLNLILTPETYTRQLAHARTWILAEQIPGLLLRGLGKGGKPESVLVIGKGEYVTEPRVEDEPVRHKMVDLIGDLALLGRTLQAHVLARRSGHALHARLVKAISGSYRRAFS